MKICPKCGMEVKSRFCPDCGTEVGEAKVAVNSEDVPAGAAREATYEAELPKAEAETQDGKTGGEVITLAHFEGEDKYHQQETVDEKIEKLEGSMSAKTTGIVAYITWIGFVIALVLGDRKGAMFHLNQALVIKLAALVCNFVTIIPFIGWLAGMVGSIFCFVCWCMGLYYACTDQEKEVPLLGQIKLLS